MGASGRLALFLGIVLSVWTVFHAYAYQRAFSIPALARAVPPAGRVALFALLWLSYPVGRVLARSAPGAFGRVVETIGAVWMGALFLAAASFLAADVVTGFGRLWPRVVRHEVKVASLPGGRAELRLVQLSDLHLGTLLGEKWLGKRVSEVNALSPDLVVVTGDLVDAEAGSVAPLAPALLGLLAPMGVFGVTGNHEFYAGLEKSLGVYESAGIRVLRDGWVEAAPGLVLTGVDDLTARRQLWPFTFLSSIPYPYQAGRYEVDGMTVAVSRGTGTWGPPMRLFFRSEIVEVILRT